MCWSVPIGTALTDWGNDGLFGDGWFVPFTADADAWDEDSDAFEEASAIIEAYETGETEVCLYDDEAGETINEPSADVRTGTGREQKDFEKLKKQLTQYTPYDILDVRLAIANRCG